MKTALLARYRLILSARLVASTHGADAADRFIAGKTGCSLRATTAQFFNNKEVVAMGIRPRTPKNKIVATLSSPE